MRSDAVPAALEQSVISRRSFALAMEHPVNEFFVDHMWKHGFRHFGGDSRRFKKRSSSPRQPDF